MAYPSDPRVKPGMRTKQTGRSKSGSLVDIRVTNNVDTGKVVKKVQTANFKSVEHALATLRKTVLNSIRRGKEKNGKRIPSTPGKTPKKWSNRSSRNLTRYILYRTYSTYLGAKTAGTVYASPDNSGDRVYQLHERGGSQTVTRIVQDRMSRRDADPNWKRLHYQPMADRSAGQQKHIRDYYNNIARLKTKKIKFRAAYPKRPFMEPAVKKILPRLPAVWRTNIQKTFH